ncbi:carbohydrate sulfotransferase 10-like isoform X1 [Styela clava]
MIWHRKVKLIGVICTMPIILCILYYSTWTPSVIIIKNQEQTDRRPNTLATTSNSLTTMSKNLTTIKTEAYSWKNAANRFYMRKKHLHGICSKKSHIDPRLRGRWVKNHNFLVDMPHKLMICAVPKTGTTTWHRTLWTMRRKREGLDAPQSLYNHKISVFNQAMVMKLNSREGGILMRHTTGDDNFYTDPPADASFRILLTRHPFARLISGWNQKFMVKSNYWAYLFKTFKRLLDYKRDVDTDYVMSFRDFSRYIIDNALSGQIDFHFIPATMLCKPCYYDFTYIVKAESVAIDEPWFLNRLNLTDVYAGRKGVPPGGSVVNGDLVENIKKYMKTLSPKLIKALYWTYKDDFEYFGYTFNFDTLEAGGFE